MERSACIAASTLCPALFTAQNAVRFIEGSTGTIEDVGPLSGDVSVALKKKVPIALPQPLMKSF